MEYSKYKIKQVSMIPVFISFNIQPQKVNAEIFYRRSRATGKPGRLGRVETPAKPQTLLYG